MSCKIWLSVLIKCIIILKIYFKKILIGDNKTALFEFFVVSDTPYYYQTPVSGRNEPNTTVAASASPSKS